MNPVHHEDGKWYFWTLSWHDREGPFQTEASAEAACLEYARNLIRDPIAEVIERFDKLDPFRQAEILRMLKERSENEWRSS